MLAQRLGALINVEQAAVHDHWTREVIRVIQFESAIAALDDASDTGHGGSDAQWTGLPQIERDVERQRDVPAEEGIAGVRPRRLGDLRRGNERRVAGVDAAIVKTQRADDLIESVLIDRAVVDGDGAGVGD